MREFPDHRKPKGQQPATKDDLIGGMAAGMQAMGQKVYTQCMEETIRMLAELEDRLRAEFGKVP